MEFTNRALQQVHTLDGQPRHVAAAEQLRRIMVECNIGKLGLLLASRRRETAVTQVERGIHWFQCAKTIHIHFRVEHAVRTCRVRQSALTQPFHELASGKGDRHQIAHGRILAKLAQRIVAIPVEIVIANQTSIKTVMREMLGIALLSGGLVCSFVRNRKRHLVEVDILYQILELSVQRIVRIITVTAIDTQVSGFRRHRPRRIPMEIAVFRIGFGSGNAHISGTDSFERGQCLAHQLADGGILLGHGLFQTNRIDMHRYALDAWIGTETQRSHHQSDTQIVVRAHASAFGVRHIHPCMACRIVSGGRHHGNACGSEADRHIAVLEAASEIHVETVRKAHAA